MDLHETLHSHRKAFRTQVIGSLASRHSISSDEVIRQFGPNIEDMLKARYTPLEEAVDAICALPEPVVLNIRRDRQREDACKICESNEPNIEEVDALFGDSITIFEIPEDHPAGALYHVLFQGEPDEDKKLPLTAVIHACDVKRVWAGKAVERSVYERLIKKSLA